MALNDVIHATDERAPLIAKDSRSPAFDDQHYRKWMSRLKIPFRLNARNDKLVPVLGILIVFLNESEFYLKSVALVRALESMACLEYYQQYDDPLAKLGKSIPEVNCKLPSIQERVAKLYGASFAFRMICAAIGTFFIITFFSTGRRRPILVVHKVNLIVTQTLIFIAYYGYPKLPIWLICFNGIFALVGGNFDLGILTMFAAYTDVIHDPGKRSSLIFVTSSMQYVSQAVCLPVASRLINLDGNGTTPEVSLWTSFACAVIVFLMTYLLFPETHRSGHAAVTTDDQVGPKDSNSSMISGHSGRERFPNEPTAQSSPSAKVSNSSSADSYKAGPYQVLKNEFGIFKIVCLLLSMFCSVTASRLVDWYGLMQYPSIKFQWTLSKTTILNASLAILSFLNFAILLPQFTKLCTKSLGLKPRAAALLLSCTSASFLLFASILMGIPTTTVASFIVACAVYTFGSGINSALHTYTVNAASSSKASGAALTVLSLGATGGKVSASFLWPIFLNLGLRLDNGSGRWGGISFFVAGGMAVAAAGMIGLAEWTDRGQTTRSDVEEDLD